ncbi:MAG: peptidylprolyl isomerase [Methylococcaceae bacterium]
MRLFIIVLMLTMSSTLSFAQDKKMSEAQTKVKFTTSLGDFVIELNQEKAPVSASNFLTYVKEGFYDDSIFHRVIPGFMAQGGGFDSKFEQKKTHEPIKNEADNGLKNERGTLAMARTNEPNSATAQFFINYNDNGALNYTGSTSQGWGYAVFGKVIEGMDIVDEMAKQPTGNRGMHQDVPKTDIVVKKAEVLQ